jgi:dihydrofolate reductase
MILKRMISGSSDGIGVLGQSVQMSIGPTRRQIMGKVIANITTSLDGYVAGPDDGPGCGLGVGGERLHHWVFGEPWSYDDFPEGGEMKGADKAYFDAVNARTGAVIAGRATYDAADAWGGSNPWPVPFAILTHRTGLGETFHAVADLDAALAWAKEQAGDKDVLIMGGADVIRQALAAGVVEELGVSTAPVVLGAGKALFDGFQRDVELEPQTVHHSPYATHVWYAVKR